MLNSMNLFQRNVSQQEGRINNQILELEGKSRYAHGYKLTSHTSSFFTGSKEHVPTEIVTKSNKKVNQK